MLLIVISHYTTINCPIWLCHIVILYIFSIYIIKTYIVFQVIEQILFIRSLVQACASLWKHKITNRSHCVKSTQLIRIFVKMPLLKLGDVVPDFEAETTEGKMKFHTWLGGSWAILFSHPADYTPVCTTELGRVQKLVPEFQKRGLKVILNYQIRLKIYLLIKIVFVSTLTFIIKAIQNILI